MKYFSIILSLVFVLSLVSAIFAQQKAQEVNFWYCVEEQNAKYVDEGLGIFNKNNAGKVEVKGTRFNSKEELKKALLTGTVMPDVSLIDVRWQSELIDKGAIVPVEKYMNEIGSSIKVVHKMDIIKPVFESCLQDNVIWTAAYACDTTVLIVNRDILNAAKISKYPQNWDEIVKVSKSIVSVGDGRFGIAFHVNDSPEDVADFFMTLVKQSGGNFFDKDGNIVFNDDKGVKTLQFLQDMYNKHKVASISTTPDDFFTGKVGMIYGDIEDYFKALELGMNVEALYLPKKDVRYGNLRVDSLALFKSTPEKEKAAFKFLYSAIGFEQVRALYLAARFVPANKQVVHCPAYFEFMNKHPGMRIYLKGLDWAKPVPNFKYYDEIMDYLGKVVILSVKGEKTPKDALDDAAKYANSLLGK
jgi:ABC-type glycerol-3-phosphate transport system substrate-binding protein